MCGMRHKKSESTAYVCDICQREFSTEAACAKHEREHKEEDAFREANKPAFQVGDIVRYEHKVYLVVQVQVHKASNGQYAYVYVIERHDEPDYNCGGYHQWWCAADVLELVVEKAKAEAFYDELEALTKARLGVSLEDFINTI